MEGYQTYRKTLENLFRDHKTENIFKCLNKQGEVYDVSYDTLHSSIFKFKEKIEEAHLKAGERILLLDYQNPCVMQLFLAASYWNIVPVMMDPGMPEAEMEAMILSLDLSAIFTSQDSPIKLSSSLTAKFPVYDIRDVRNNYPDLINSDRNLENTDHYRDPNIAVIILSSGTTSRAKAVEISYEAFLNSVNKCIQLSSIKSGDNMLLVFPLFHISGLASALTVLFKGNMLIMPDEFHPSDLQKLLQTFEPEIFGMVPKVFELMVDKLEKEVNQKKGFILAYYHFSFKVASFFNRYFNMAWPGRILMHPFAKALFGKKIRILPIGASGCDGKTAETLINMGLRFFYVYASTECGVPIATIRENDSYPINTVGKVNSVEGVDIMIKDPDIYGKGEIYVKTDQIMTSYFKDPELTKEAFDEGYFKTGDIGYIDHEGYLHVTGRSKEMILLETGKKGSPEDLETVLADLSYSTAVCGIPDNESGFDKIYIFVLNKNYAEDEKKECQKKINERFRIKAAQYPIEKIVFVSEIPKTAVGKIKRNLLKESILKDRPLNQTGKEETHTIKKRADEGLESWILSLFAGEADIPLTTSWKEIGGFDSLKLMEILVEIENETGVYIGEKITDLDTINDIVSYIREKRGKYEKNK